MTEAVLTIGHQLVHSVVNLTEQCIAIQRQMASCDVFNRDQRDESKGRPAGLKEKKGKERYWQS